MPVIDYHLVLAMTPSLIVGLALGVLVNAVISQWLLNLLIIAIWTWSSIRLCFSYRAARVEEKRQQQQKQTASQQEQRQEQEPGQQEQHAMQQMRETTAAMTMIGTGEVEMKPADGQRRFQLVICCDEPQQVVCGSGNTQDLSVTDSNTTNTSGGLLHRVQICCTAVFAAVSSWASYQPWLVIAATSVLFVFFIACQVVQGLFTPKCSNGYWAVMGLLCGVGVAAAALVSWWLLRSVERVPLSVILPQTAMPAALAAAAAAKPISIDILFKAGVAEGSCSGSVVRWTRGMLASIHLQMLVAGLMLGAWPLSPIILAIPGMHPQVGAGTSKLMLFLITAGAGLSFIAAGNINISYLLVYGLVNAVATPIGVWVVDWAIKRTGRPSCIIMLTIVRLMVCVVLQAALQAVPSLIALAHGLPRAGFVAQPFCHGKV